MSASDVTTAPGGRNYADSHQVVKVSSKRFDTSPWFRHYVAEDPVLGVYSQRFYPLSLGADPAADYWHLRREVMLFDVPERPIEISGPDAERFLDHLLTRDMRTVPSGRARYSLACSSDGGVLMDGVLIRLEASRFWYVMADGDFLGWMRAHGEQFDVTITDPESWVLQVQGPRSLEVLRALTGGSMPNPFPYFGVATAEVGGQSLLISRTGWTGELGFEIYTTPETDHDRLWSDLHIHGAAHGLRLGSLECMGIRRLEAGILDNGTDMDPSMTPYAAGLGRFVDLDKSEFVGRDVLSVADQRPLLFGISGPVDLVAGSSVRLSNEVVGTVTASAWSPSLERGIGYVRFKDPGVPVEGPFDVDGSGSGFVVTDLPFLDPERRLPRGIALA